MTPLGRAPGARVRLRRYSVFITEAGSSIPRPVIVLMTWIQKWSALPRYAHLAAESHCHNRHHARCWSSNQPRNTTRHLMLLWLLGRVERRVYNTHSLPSCCELPVAISVPGNLIVFQSRYGRFLPSASLGLVDIRNLCTTDWTSWS